MEKTEYEQILKRVGEKALEVAQLRHGVQAARHAYDMAGKHLAAMGERLAAEQARLDEDIHLLTNSKSHWPVDKQVISMTAAEPRQ